MRSRNHHRPGALRLVCAACALAMLLPASAAFAATVGPSAVSASFEQSDPHWVFTGAWSTYSSAALSGGSHAVASAAGSSMSMPFTGSRLDLVATTGPKFGIAHVSVDGGAPVVVDLYTPDTAFQQTVFSTGDIAAGFHTVTVTVTGTANAASADTFVGLDSAVITGMPCAQPIDQGDNHIVTRGAWMSYSSPSLIGGSHFMTGATGDQASVAFTGTRLDLVALTGPKMGIVTVSVDGGAPVDVDLYSPASRFRQVVFSTGDLAAGPHTVLVTASGRKNLAAEGTYASIDGVILEGTISQALLRYEETEPKLGWGGGIAAYADYGASGSRYITAGPSWGAVNVSFEGARMDWVALTGPQFGIANVSLDGGPSVDVDLYSPTVGYQRVVYSTGQLGWGTHTVQISWSGRRNGAAVERYVTMDAFDIGGRPVQAVAPVAPAVGVPTPFNYPWNRYIVVDKSERQLYFVEQGMLVKVYPVAVGKASTPTPNGIWRIDAKYYSSGVFGPRKMRMFRQQGSSFVYTAYNIHGTNVDSSIGTYASHGCIRMHNYDVLEFYPMVPLGTMVVTRD